MEDIRSQQKYIVASVPDVELERGGVGERARADLTGVRPLTRVYAHMYGQLTPLVEPVP